MPISRAGSYRVCEAIARRAAANFYPAFCLLPRRQRLAMCALYAFCRITDDIGDEAGETDLKRRQLTQWRVHLDRALGGDFTHPIHAALADMTRSFGVPLEYLHDIIDGVEMDLDAVGFETYADLRRYCYRVASAVGLACIHIWGVSTARAMEHAEEAGIAFQLTNILRDLKEDALRGRLYLPREDLLRFGYTPEELGRGAQTEAFRRLMGFEVERTREHYRRAWPLAALLPSPGRAVFLTMARTYRALLENIERGGYDVFSRRIRVSAWKKALLAVGALPVRLGWL